MQYRFQNGERVYEIAIERRGDTYQAVIDGQAYDFEVLETQPGQLSIRFNDRPATIYWAADGAQKWLSMTGCTYRLQKPVPRPTRAPGEAGGGESVRAPMPAQVRAVQVAEGVVVEKGQTLLLLEAMKMEIRVKASAGGKVTRLLVQAGQTVDKDQLLAEITPTTQEEKTHGGEVF